MDVGARTLRQVALRCRIVLAAAAGESDVAISKRLSANRNTVILRRKRFRDGSLDGLWDIAPGRGRKPGIRSTRSPVSWMPACRPNRRDDASELPDYGGELRVSKSTSFNWIAAVFPSQPNRLQVPLASVVERYISTRDEPL